MELSGWIRYTANMSERSFTIHEIEGYIASIFLVESQEGLLLLDGGCRGDAARIEDFITGTLQRPMTDLRLMLVSHMHPDHAGGAPVLRKKYGIPIAAHHLTDKWYRGWRGWLQNRVDRHLAQFSARKNDKKRESVRYPRKIRPDLPLKEGDVLPGFPDWKVIVLPGHTLFDSCMFNSRESVFYAADMVLFMNGKFMLPFPIPFPDKMRVSLDRMAEIKAETLLLAHGGILSSIDLCELVKTMKEKIGKTDNPMFQRIAPFTVIGPEIKKGRRNHLS